MPPLSLDVALQRRYSIYLTALTTIPHILHTLEFRKGRCLLVTDGNVATHYLGLVFSTLEKADWSCKVLILDPGETSKSTHHLQIIYDAALAWGIDRDTLILALGGGVIGDVAGYAAATLLRGLPLIHIPTTLIAQVDSSIGGKTGINHASGKNLIGAFYQPRAVIADLSTLHTLPEREWTSGLAEVVKHALIADKQFLVFLENNWHAVLQRAYPVIQEMVFMAAGIKARIVSEDEKEQGVRTLLNFGHTFGHAIERAAGYGQFTHGEAVALGMRAALHLSRKLHPRVDFTRAIRMVEQIPVRHTLKGLSIEDLISAMRTDKKVQRGKQRLVLLREPGDAYITRETIRADITYAWKVLF